MSSIGSGRFTVSQTLEVCSHAGTEQEIPKAQRQGAIIILGMLGIAKREIVTERVESLLKIGLGPLGMVRASH